MDWLVSMRGSTPWASKGHSRRQLLLLGLASCMAGPSAFARGGGRPGSFSAIDGDADGTIDLDERSARRRYGFNIWIVIALENSAMRRRSASP